MVRLCSDLGWAAKQISAMVVGHCFLREGLCLGIVREVLKFQNLKVLITRVPPPVIADGSGYALCARIKRPSRVRLLMKCKPDVGQATSDESCSLLS